MGRRPGRRGKNATCLIAILGLLIPSPAPAPRRPPSSWERDGFFDPPRLQIDHDEWDAFLSAISGSADGVHRVAYGEVTPADRALLENYIARLAALPISAYSRPEQMAYWINLYNALVVRLVVDHYPIASIRDIGKAGCAGPRAVARSWSRSRARRCRSMTSRTASCARSGAIRGSTMRLPAAP